MLCLRLYAQNDTEDDSLLSPDMFTIREEGGSEDDDLHGADSGDSIRYSAQAIATNISPDTSHTNGADNGHNSKNADAGQFKASWGQQKHHPYRQTIKRLLSSVLERQSPPAAIKAMVQCQTGQKQTM